jgi:hypothetical protein
LQLLSSPFARTLAKAEKEHAMGKRSKRNPGKSEKDQPVEVRMTDLGWPEEGKPQDNDASAEPPDTHAAGTPGGGTATGGLAGTNVGHGDPDDAALEAALGSGIHDNSEVEGGPPFAGAAGGAVGGTPAEKRSKGGRSARKRPSQ